MSVKLVYFDIRGRAELPRLTLALAGKDFDDTRYSFEDWPKHKSESPSGQLPYAELGGKKFTQSVALANYFARDNGLYGKSALDALRIDEVMGLGQDVWQFMGKIFSEKDEAKKADILKKGKDEDLPKIFTNFDTMLKQGTDGVYVGSSLTLADLCVYDLMFTLKGFAKYDAADAFPQLKALYAKVEANPKIKAYLAKRKATEF